MSNLYVDASLTRVGGCWDKAIYAIPVGLIIDLPMHLGMLNVFIAPSVWKEGLAA